MGTIYFLVMKTFKIFSLTDNFLKICFLGTCSIRYFRNFLKFYFFSDAFPESLILNCNTSPTHLSYPFTSLYFSCWNYYNLTNIAYYFLSQSPLTITIPRMPVKRQNCYCLFCFSFFPLSCLFIMEKCTFGHIYYVCGEWRCAKKHYDVLRKERKRERAKKYRKRQMEIFVF